MTRRALRRYGLVLGALLVMACGRDDASKSRAVDKASTGGTGSSTVVGLDLSQALEVTASQGTQWKPMLVDAPSPEVFPIEARNATDVTLGIASALAGDDAAEFSIERQLAFESLAPGDTAWVSVKYAPTRAGKKDASVQFTVWDPDDPTNRQIFAIMLDAEAKPWAYVGQRGLSLGSAGSYLKLSDPANPGRVGRPGDRSMALVADGNVLYLAYKDGTELYDPSDTESGKLTVAKYEAGLWTTLGTAGFSDGDAMWIGLAVHQGIPYVAYTDGVAPMPPAAASATVMKFDGQGWVPVGAKHFTPGSAAYASLYVADNLGQPDLYLSFQDGAPHLEVDGTDRHAALSVMRFTENAWTYLGLPTFTYPELSSSSTSMVVADGVPYVAYGSGLVRYDSTSATWTKVASFSASSTALLTNATGELYLAISDLAYEGKATVFSYTAGTLLALGERGFSLGLAEFLSLGWNAESLLVAFKDGGNREGVEGGAIAAEFFGGDWSTLGAGTASPGVVNHLSLAAGAGQVYLGYKDEDWKSTPTLEGSGMASVIVKK